MTVPYVFANATSSLPLSELDTNFATPITLGNTSVYLGNTYATLVNVNINGGNLTSNNVLITGGTISNVAIANVTYGGLGTMALQNANSVTITGGSVNATHTGNGIGLTGLNASNVASGTLGVAYGGTGSANLTAGYLVTGNNTSQVVLIAPGTSGNVLTSNGTAWYSNVSSGGGGSTGIGNSSILALNVNITANATINAGVNGFSVGPITTANGISVTVSSGQRWVII